LNLLGNAVKFTGDDQSRPGQIVIYTEARALPDDKVALEIRVQDNGIGMSEEAQTRLFHPFVQGENSTTRRFGGTGLGLSICRRLIDMMGGTISAESRPGEGSTFFVRLVCDIAPEEKPERVFNFSGVNVLVLSPIQHKLPGTIIERYLSTTGARVALACQQEHLARLAHDLAKDNQSFVAIMDKHNNLGMAEALRERIRQESASVQPRFIMLSRRGRRGFYSESDDTIIVNLEAMRLETFLHAVACASGRASPEFDESQAQLACGESPSAAGPPLDGALILVAEDNQTNQKVFAHQIARLGHPCEIVENGRLALERWRQGNYALLLTDCHMPEMDGYELARAIRQEQSENRRIPIIAITADALKGTKELCLAAGMDDYLPKPIQLNELQQKLKTWLPQRGLTATIHENPAPAMPVSDPQVVDPGALSEVLGLEDKRLFADFYQDFLRSGEESVSAVRAAYDGRQSREVGALAHRLKSSARTIGARALADCCLALELAGKLADWTAIDKHMVELRNHFGAVQQWIQQFSAEVGER
jgi:CheY-like chemotaxis protein/HPt (histidine-containing phosphotransfer) domain-containing protein